MRIAQIAPLYESVPPKRYGGIERVVSWLTEELVSQGHDVTLFASGDSQTTAHLYAGCEKPLRLDQRFADKTIPHMLMMEVLTDPAWQFDIVHYHGEYQHLPSSLRLPITTRSLATCHRQLETPYLKEFLTRFPEAHYVSISDSQRRPLPWLNWLRTIHHGMPEGLYSFQKKRGDYLAFVGRMSPNKGPDLAIAIARQFQMPLKMAAKIGEVEKGYYHEVIEPMLTSYPSAEYIGEITDAEKDELIGNAYALLHPVRFQEPFGLVLIESLACGTPVVAFGNGSIPEVIEHGLTGFVCNDVDSAVQALAKIPQIDRRTCRSEFERRFGVSRMAQEYIEVYQALLNQ